MKTDLIERLRKAAMGDTPIPTLIRALLSEAADELEESMQEQDRLQKLACSNCDVGCPADRRTPSNCEIIGTGV